MVKRLRFLPFVLSGKLESGVSGRKFNEVDDCEVGYCNLFSTQTKPRMTFVIPGFLISRFYYTKSFMSSYYYQATMNPGVVPI